MAEVRSFHGWQIRYGEDGEGHPLVEMTKPGRTTMGEIGEHGIDPEVMLQRLKPRVLEQEVAAAESEEERRTWGERLFTAITERDNARELRVAQAAQAARTAQRRADLGLDTED